MKKELQEKLDRLESLTRKMDVPSGRRRNPGWLNRNLCVRNLTHKDYEIVMELVKELLSNGVTHD